jgi:pimeloyl-ACP methyl ester carboxylesterase
MTDKTQSIYLSSSDGIRLYARVYGDPASKKLPIVCLPGLTRNADDFDAMAEQLVARVPARKIIALDYRGRGRSQFALDAAHYSVAVEAVDVRQVLAALGITRAIFIGTSRGGLITMLLALTAPELIAAVILNDIGPVLETRGLQRIASYVGKGSMPKTMDEALARIKEINTDFTDLDEDEWHHLTRMSFRETATGAVALTYDVALSRGFLALDFSKPQPTLWPLFDALKPVPVLVIRGENSDLLSEATVKEMVTRHPQCSSFISSNEAHAPLVGRIKTVEVVFRFIEGITCGA